jgi:hypothetical protein
VPAALGSLPARLIISIGSRTAASKSFRCQPSLDVVVDRFDYDASRFAFGLQLARVDKFVQLLA